MPAPFSETGDYGSVVVLLSYSDGICCMQLTLGHHTQGSNLITSAPKSRKTQISIMIQCCCSFESEGAIQGGTRLG